jgi:hypothetical protein
LADLLFSNQLPKWVNMTYGLRGRVWVGVRVRVRIRVGVGVGVRI